MVECAITGTLSGNAIGLHEVTTHVSRLAISWGVSFFGANLAAWQALPADIRETLREGLKTLETEVWDAAERQTEDGLACLAGRPNCRAGRPGRMTIVEERWQDESRRLQLLGETILPGWLQRCGPECSTMWNRDIAAALGLRARSELGMQGRPFRIVIALAAALLMAALAGGTLLLLERMRQTAQAAAHDTVERSARVVETAVNRHLLAVDGMLAGLPAILGTLPRNAEGAPDRSAVNRRAARPQLPELHLPRPDAGHGRRAHLGQRPPRLARAAASRRPEGAGGGRAARRRRRSSAPRTTRPRANGRSSSPGRSTRRASARCSRWRRCRSG